MNKKQVKSDPYNTVLVICIGLLIVYSVTRSGWSLNTAIIIGLLAILSKTLADLIAVAWMKLGAILGQIVPNILLGLIFFLILTPIAWVSRVFVKKDPMGLKNADASFFREHTAKFDKAYFENPW